MYLAKKSAFNFIGVSGLLPALIQKIFAALITPNHQIDIHLKVKSTVLTKLFQDQFAKPYK